MKASQIFLVIVLGVIVVIVLASLWNKKKQGQDAPKSECDLKLEELGYTVTFDELLKKRMEDVRNDASWLQSAYYYYPQVSKDEAVRLEATKVLSKEIGCKA